MDLRGTADEPGAAPVSSASLTNGGVPRRALRVVAALAGIAVLFLLPSLMPNNYFRSLLILGMIYAIYGIGFDVQFGYTGVFNLGHGMFFGVGAYTVALMSHYLEITNVLITIPLAIVAGLVAAVIVCIVALKRDGLQLAMISLGLSQVAFLVVLNEDQITRGPVGMSVDPATLSIGPLFVDLNSQNALYTLVLACLLASVYIVRRVLASRLGSSWLCVRENLVLARSQGIRPVRARASAVLFGGGLAAGAGGLFAYNLRFLTPELFALIFIVTALIVVMVGGAGTTYGAILGALLFTVVPEYLRAAAERRLLVFGAVLAVVMFVLPDGLFPLLTRTVGRIRNRGKAQ